jgi:hypothetical protein
MNKVIFLYLQDDVDYKILIRKKLLKDLIIKF